MMIKAMLKKPKQKAYLKLVEKGIDGELLFESIKKTLGEYITQTVESKDIVCFSQVGDGLEPCIEVFDSTGIILYGKVLFFQLDKDNAVCDLDKNHYDKIRERYDQNFPIVEAVKQEDPYKEFIDILQAEVEKTEDIYDAKPTMLEVEPKKWDMAPTAYFQTISRLRQVKNVETQTFIMTAYYKMLDDGGNVGSLVYHLHLLFCDRGWVSGLHT